jgi:sec-independent protein translocase protein TatB
VLDIGLGELIVIAILALLVFGPDRLPKVAADAARTLRQVRQMAVSARKDLADAAGFEDDDELNQAVRDIRDLDPRRALRGLGEDVVTGGAGTTGTAAPRGAGAGGAAAGAPGRNGSGATGPNGSASAGTAGATGAGASPSGSGRSGSGDGVPGGSGSTEGADSVAGPVLEAAPVDPDWT